MNRVLLIIMVSLLFPGISGMVRRSAVSAQISLVPYDIVEDSLFCYFSKAHFISRHLMVFLEPKNFSLPALRKLLREISFRFERPDELFVSVETDREVLNCLLALHPSPEHGHRVLDAEYECIKDKPYLHATYYRYRGNESLRYTPSEGAETLETVILNGTDLLYSESLGFEVVLQRFATVAQEVECNRRSIVLLMSQDKFGEDSLTSVFRYFDDLYPAPSDLDVSVYTSAEQFRKAYPYLPRYYTSRLRTWEGSKKALEHTLSAHFFRDSGAAYFSYTMYPFSVNSYGGLATKRVDIRR